MLHSIVHVMCKRLYLRLYNHRDIIGKEVFLVLTLRHYCRLFLNIDITLKIMDSGIGF